MSAFMFSWTVYASKFLIRTPIVLDYYVLYQHEVFSSVSVENNLPAMQEMQVRSLG